MVGYAVDVMYRGDDRNAVGSSEVAFQITDGVAFGCFAVASGEGLRAGAKVDEVLATVVRVKGAATVDDEFDGSGWQRFGIVDLRGAVWAGVNESCWFGRF